jgi:hypothetical protein
MNNPIKELSRIILDKIEEIKLIAVPINFHMRLLKKNNSLLMKELITLFHLL